jgi:hypothetical protein
VRFISEHKSRFGVEPICRVLTDHGVPIAPSTYYDAIRRPPGARAVRDGQLKAHIARVHADNYGVYGARKVWLALKPGVVLAVRGDSGVWRGQVAAAGNGEHDARRAGRGLEWHVLGPP